MTKDAEVVSDALSWITKAPFEIAEPGRNRLLLQKEATWFVACLDLAYVEKTGHLDRAWKDRKGLIWFETSEIADMIRLVENLYGENGATKMTDAEVGKPPAQTIPKEVIEFTDVVNLLNEYQRIVSKIGKRNGVDLRLLYDGGAGLTTVRIAFPTSFNSDDVTETREVVEQVSGILREAYNQVLEAKVDRVESTS